MPVEISLAPIAVGFAQPFWEERPSAHRIIWQRGANTDHMKRALHPCVSDSIRGRR